MRSRPVRSQFQSPAAQPEMSQKETRHTHEAACRALESSPPPELTLISETMDFSRPCKRNLGNPRRLRLRQLHGAPPLFDVWARSAIAAKKNRLAWSRLQEVCGLNKTNAKSTSEPCLRADVGSLTQTFDGRRWCSRATARPRPAPRCRLAPPMHARGSPPGWRRRCAALRLPASAG